MVWIPPNLTLLNNVDTTQNITHISLCAGYGGIDLGLRAAIPSLRTIAFSEIEAYPCANLVSKIEEGLLDEAPIWTDLKTFPWESFRGKVDILSGGFPCQPFSCAGRRKGSDDPRHLFPHILKGIRATRVPLVFLENVDGIVSSKLGEGWSDEPGTPVLLHVLRELEREGYHCTWGTFSASEVGASHQRRRIFILACSGVFQEHTSSLRLQRCLPFSRTEGSSPTEGTGSWPARPNEQQYGWEAPRVLAQSNYRNGWKSASSDEERKSGSAGNSEGSMANSNDIRAQRVNGDFNSERQTIDQAKRQNCIPVQDKSKAKPKMGRAAYGLTSRVGAHKLQETCDSWVDEIRILGNGVVPQTATLAFTTLFQELTQPPNLT